MCKSEIHVKEETNINGSMKNVLEYSHLLNRYMNTFENAQITVFKQYKYINEMCSRIFNSSMKLHKFSSSTIWLFIIN